MTDTEELEEMQKFRRMHIAKWWRKYKLRGKWLLIKGKNITGIFNTSEAAYAEGTRRYGNRPYLVTRVIDEEKEKE